MAVHRSLESLSSHLGSSSGLKMLLNKENIKNALKSEMDRLQHYLIEEINNYLSSYSPIQYQRTGAWLESIRVNPIVQVGNSLSISLTFDNDMAYHPSAIGGEDGYVPWLFEVGWDIRDKFNGVDNRFTHFDGTHYIKHAVERWNRDNKFGFKISVYHGDEIYI